MELISHRPQTKPAILIVSGMHGNECESADLLRHLLDTQDIVLPPYLSIFSASPSARAQKTRRNAQGNDINRQFFETTADQEATAIMDAIRYLSFRVAIDIHEDPDRTLAFYIYDTERMRTSQLMSYRHIVHTTKARLYTGIDDLEDEHLRSHIEKGYYAFRSDTNEDTDRDAGFFSKWVVKTGVAPRVFTVEIPGKAPATLKRSLLTAVIPFLASDTFWV